MRSILPVLLLGAFSLTATATAGEPAADPFWAGDRLFHRAPEAPVDPRERAGALGWDPTSAAWFRAWNGMIVLLHDDGTAPLVVDGVQGVDADLRAAEGVAVSREPDHRIVLHRWDQGRVSRRVLAHGPMFFAPRLSPDGRRVLFAESRAGGGRVWVAAVDGGPARDLGQGYGPAWSADSGSILVARLRYDGERILESGLWRLDAESGQASLLLDDPAVLELEPAASPDGRSLAFVDGITGEVRVLDLPAAPRAEGGAP